MAADVAPGKIDLTAIVRTPPGNQMDISLRLIISDAQHWLEWLPRGHSLSIPTGPILPRPNRNCRFSAQVALKLAAARPEPAQSMREETVAQVFSIFREAHTEVSRNARTPYVIAVVFRPGLGWPNGRFDFDDYLLACVDVDDWDGPYVLLAKKVAASSANACVAEWHDHLNTVATLIAILSDREIRLERGTLPGAVAKILEVPNPYPLVEHAANSRLLDFASQLQIAELASPYDGPHGANFIPEDLGDMVARFDNLPGKRKQVIGDALAALQVGVQLGEGMPTLALTALLTAVERLVDWLELPKTDPPCDACGQARPRTQDAMLELMSDVLNLNSRTSEAARTCC
jgi:hypothetical protein